jgi:hypothetical protein
MGIFDWLQRKGSVGSVVRWSYKHYSRIHLDEPDLTAYEICEYIFKVRYSGHITLSNSAKEWLKIIEDIPKRSIIDLCMFIYQIEMGIRPLSDYTLYHRIEKNANIVLENLNKKNHTHYN